MKKKFLSLIALVALAVGITVAVNYVPSNGLKLLGKAEKAEFAGVGSGFASLATDPMTLMKAPAEMKASAALPKTADEGWSEWEEFAPVGSNDAVWTLTAWQKGAMNVKTYVRTSTTDATKKQIKCAGWGAGLFTPEGVDILLDWNTTTNAIEIPMQSTGYYVSNYKDYAVLGTFKTGKYDPEQGKFTFYVGYSVPQYYVMKQAFGFGDETLQMAGKFKDYSISFSRGTVDDAATPIKQTVNVVPGKDITSYRVHVDTYENYAAAQGSAAYFEALAKAEGTDYTTPSATVELQGSSYGIYVVVVSAFANGEMKIYDYDVYEVSPASDWETIGTRPYREDIVTSVYNFQVTGPIYDVEVQKHKTYKDVYRIKNPYGSTSPFKSYTLYENAYLYLNAQNSAKVTPTFQLAKCDLGIDIAGGVPMDVSLADKTVGGTFDGYAITFPTNALVSTNYYANENGLFRAVINFRDAEFAFADDAKSIYTGETVKITSNNTLSTPTFESLTPEIATVDAKGVVTAVAPGKAQIKVTQDAYLEFNAKEAVMEINVEKNPNSYASFVFNTDEGLGALGIEKPAASAAVNLTGMALQNGVVSMTTTDGGTATRVYNSSGATDLRMYKNGGSFTFSVPEGYKIISMDFTGAECSLFGEESEFETCTKTHTVWNAPADTTITSKTFAAVGTCKIGAIKVKYSASATLSVDYSTIYTSNVELIAGENSGAAVIKYGDGEYDGVKCGTASKAGSCTMTIPAGTKMLHFHAIGWKGAESTTMTVNGTEYTIASDDGISGNSPFTLVGKAENHYYTFDPKGATEITFTSSKRFVVFGVNYELPEGAVEVPSFSPSETDFVDSVEISLSCDTEGADIFYNIGSEVTSMNAIQYTAPFTISETSTIYAVAKKDGKESAQVSKTYKLIPSFASLAELLEKLPAQEASTKVSVTLTDLPIDSFYVAGGGYKNGVYTNVNGTVVELYERSVPEAWEVGGTISGKITGEWLLYKGIPEFQKWEGGWDALTYKPASLLPPLASNAYYSWQSPKGVVEEVGGKAVAVGDTTRVNYANTTTDTKFFTICLVGKKKLEADKDGIVKYITVTLDQALAEGDTIYVYAFKNKDDASKKASIMFLWGEEGTEKTMAGGDDFPNLYGGGEPALVKYVVPKDAAGQKAFRMTRSETGTNLFIAQLQIVPNQTPTGINDISAKNAQFFGEGTYDLSGRKVMNPIKGNVYIVNGKKYLCK